MAVEPTDEADTVLPMQAGQTRADANMHTIAVTATIKASDVNATDDDTTEATFDDKKEDHDDDGTTVDDEENGWTIKCSMKKKREPKSRSKAHVDRRGHQPTTSWRKSLLHT